MCEYSYVGQELDLFARATTWKRYFRARVTPYLGDEILEVGAGHGGTTRLLCRGREKRWVCLEPDAELHHRLAETVRDGRLPPCCTAVRGTLRDVASSPAFDTLLYIDVLEHIENDREELALARERLRAGGHLVVLAPAHPWLYTPFDEAIGHHRRYTKRTLRAIAPDGLRLARLRYLDSVGLMASAGNRLLLRRSMPTARQIALWDRVFVRLSRLIDPLLFYTVGKSVLAVWKKCTQ